MRRAEFVMATVMGIFSLYLMWKSAELPIGWVPRRGPGGGALPFWLSLGMLICCAVILWRGFRRVSPPSRSVEPYMDGVSLRLFAISAGSLGVMLLAINWIGIYLAMPLFFIFYLRFVGRHSWLVTGAVAIGGPIVTFFFFEIGLKILLPKGYTEPLFYPLYAYFL
jgi:hypothetical protein